MPTDIVFPSIVAREQVGVDRAALVRDAEASGRLLALIGTSAEELRFSGQLAVQQQ